MTAIGPRLITKHWQHETVDRTKSFERHDDVAATGVARWGNGPRTFTLGPRGPA